MLPSIERRGNLCSFTGRKLQLEKRLLMVWTNALHVVFDNGVSPFLVGRPRTGVGRADGRCTGTPKGTMEPTAVVPPKSAISGEAVV